MIYSLIRNILFQLDAEFVHHQSLANLKRFKWLLPHTQVKDPVQLFGITFPNRVGLAAGLDKDGDCFDALAKFGFGFIEIGTVTPVAQLGNDKPRLFRIPKYQAIINRFGFNNLGVDNLIENVKKSQFTGVLGINIGKNKNTPNENAMNDYLIGLEKVYPFADYITINISSPNTPDLRRLQFGQALKYLLTTLKNKQNELAQSQKRYVPLLVKVAPDLEEEDILELCTVLTQTKMDGVIATNTTINKKAVSLSKLSLEEGGLSGSPLTQVSTEVIRRLRIELGDEMPIIGVGGIMSAQDAIDKINAGANLVQIYTGFIYQGPILVKQIAQALKKHYSSKIS